jgi:hypothetical protein
MINSWLTAHAIFVSGITHLYCLWTSAQIRQETSLEDVLRQASSCTKLLITLGKNWSVAQNAQSKFERLVEPTAEGWKNNRSGTMTPAMQVQMQQQQTSQQQTQGENLVGVDAGGAYPPMENPPSNFWDQYNADYMQDPNIIMDELGDLGTWLDLEWLSASDLTYQMGAYR